MDSIRVLYVEGDAADQEATHRHLVRHAPHIKLTVVETVAEAVERVTIGDMDVMLADYRLPDGTGLDLLDAVKSRGLEVPVVLVTAAGDADTTVRLLKAGAAARKQTGQRTLYAVNLTGKPGQIVAKAERLADFAEQHGHSLLELAFSWLAARPTVASVIAGATKPEQIEANVKAVGWKLTPVEIAEIDKVAA